MPSIYKTTNLVNGKFYVGQDSNDNPNYLGSGTYLARAILKYERSNFVKEILEYCEKDQLNEREIFWIAKLKSNEVGYNLTVGGDGFKGKHTEESKLKMSKAKKGITPAWMSQDNAFEIRSKGSSGRVESESHKQTISSSVKCFFDENPDTMKKAWKSHPEMGMTNKNHSNHSKELMSLRKGRAIIQRNLDGTLIREWRTIREAEREMNTTLIGLCCRKKRDSAAGFKWEYKKLN